MKVLLIILCAMRIAALLNLSANYNQKEGKLTDIVISVLMIGLWVASLVWLIKL